MMDEVLPGLWIGDLPSAMDAERLRAHGVRSVLSAMRGRISIHETFVRHQIPVDDSADADILAHLLPAARFIQAERDKGRGVLVHCMAGISRSATVVAAYLMYTQNVDPETALEAIRKVRPCVEPNPGFQQQLALFHAARYEITRKDKAVRMFYLGRAVEEVMNGDGSAPETAMFAKYPHTPPSDSAPPTPGGASASARPRRRIRCKMCRQELATREHMLDHGQLGPPTPALGNSPAGSRRPSASFGAARGEWRGMGMSAIDETRADADAIPEDGALRAGESALEIDDEGEGGGGGEGDAAPVTQFMSPADLALQLGVTPALAALRSPALPGGSPLQSALGRPAAGASAPILANPKCSGYFLEPMKWMDHFLSSGQLAGKITCPNKKCGAKLGNYDWAGQCCGCKEWVTPGFCINRSKVDEVV